MKDLTIIIVNWNTESLLKKCLESIQSQTRIVTYEIYVVDNASVDDSIKMVQTYFPSVKLIINKGNNGFAAANNQVLKVAKSRNYLLLNPDTEIIDGAIDKMIEFKDNSEFDVVTCKLINTDNTLQKSVNSFYGFYQTLLENRLSAIFLNRLQINSKSINIMWDHNSETSIDWARGAVMLFSDEVKEKVGILDERFFIYGEEIDYYYRVKRSAFISGFTPHAVIKHHGRASSRQRRAIMFIQNYKSFYQFLLKHYSIFSYMFYRIRVHLLLLLWLIYYLGAKIISGDPESEEQYQVYKETLLWHYTSESFQLG